MHRHHFSFLFAGLLAMLAAEPLLEVVQPDGSVVQLAFTLTLIDLLTDGELTGGARVAVTGTISGGGVVGDVGGVAQKARAAEEAGADLFIVPVAAVEAARSTTDDLSVVGVADLEEAQAELSEATVQPEG